ncbi:MAG: BON domain-containing protein [Verrucomicrobiales bacterium]
MKNRTIRGIFGLFAAGSMFLAGCAGGSDSRSTGEIIDDTAIHAKVKAALVNDPIITGRAVDVDVVKGVVGLRGAVNSEAERKKAEDTAWGVEGVRAVDNQLLVRGEAISNTDTNTPTTTTTTTTDSPE